MEVNKVVHAVISRDNKFLLGRRSSNKKYGPECWASVGGRVKAHEPLEDAIIRECAEEVGIPITIKKNLVEKYFGDGSSFHTWFLVKIVSGEPFLANDEHSELAWLTLAEIEHLSPIFELEIDVYRNLTLYI